MSELTTQVANRKAEAGERLTAKQYDLTPAGIECTIRRMEPGAADRRIGAPEAPRLPWWTAHVDRGMAFSVSWDGDGTGDNGWGPVQRYIVTEATFPFDPDADGEEEIALEHARAYCVDVANAIAALRPSLAGLVERVERTIVDAVRQHHAVPTTMR